MTELMNLAQTMSSREISELTGKMHKHVLVDCDKLNENYNKMNMDEISSVNFKAGNGRDYREYKLTRMQTFDLVTGYSAELRIKVNRRWEQLEIERNKPLSFEEMVKQTLIIADKRIKALEAKIVNDKPKVNFANAITGTTSNIDFETFAKVIYDQEGIRIGRNRLMKWFRDSGYMTKANKPYQNILDRVLMMLKEGSYINQSTNELVTYTQPRITGKGQIYFLNKIIDEQAN